jgi:hypothetical protein
VERVEAGEEITITRHGAAVANLVPVKREVRSEERAAIGRIQMLATGLSLGGVKVKDLIVAWESSPWRALCECESTWLNH